MKEDKLKALNNKRAIKLKNYIATPATSWKKKLRKLELDITDGRIRIERLKRQYQ